MEFSVGDRVRVKDEYSNSSIRIALGPGNDHVITSIYKDGRGERYNILRFCDRDYGGWYAYRFEQAGGPW